MKALVIETKRPGFAGLSMSTIPSPTLAGEEVKIRMVASRINPVDMDLAKGMPFTRYRNPQIAGVDGSGIILETGASVTGFRKGEAVFFYLPFNAFGSWAEEITVPARFVARIPGGMTPIQGGSIALPLLTAYVSIEKMNGTPGETILIHGAAGGVGLQAVQIAIAKGYKVIATSGVEDREVLNSLGVSKVIDFRSQDFQQELATGNVEHVLDVMGGKVLWKSLQLKPRSVVSLKMVDPDQLPAAGMNFPSWVSWILRLSNRKFTAYARRNGIRLMGQVTGPDGEMLAKAAEMAGIPGWKLSQPGYIEFDRCAHEKLNSSSVGKVLLFSQN